MRVIVAAVPGSGKTTIMDIIRKGRPDIDIVNVGSMIAELARKELKITNRDHLRKRLTIEQQRQYQYKTAMQIAGMKSRRLIIDTHTSVKTPVGYFPGTSEEPAHIIKPDVIVLLEYNPSDIIFRRRKDGSRIRDVETPEEIEEHQMSSRYYAFSAALHAQCAVRFIKLRFKEKRPFEHSKIAADEIVKLFEFER